ncbi:MAG: GAF domain-containing protein [Anaerolineales bacterium]|nr:GAF domain-containing protein [Anaerolineales bacterium]
MAIPLRLLIVEDSPDDAELLLRELRRAGYDVEASRVEDEEHFLAGLHDLPQIILMDYRLPEFSALRGLAILRERSLNIPCIVISGILSDETAVECIRQGAADYLLKDRLARLGAAVERAITEKEVKADKHRTEQALHESEAQFLRLTENAADIILRYRRGADPCFLYINPSVRKITGFSQEEFYAAPQLWAERVSVDGQGEALEAESDRTGIALVQLGPKLRFLRKDGTTAWLEQRVVTVQNGSEDADTVEGVIRDITENEQRDRELKAIASVASAMRSAPTRTDIYPIVLQQLMDLLQADGVALAMKDGANDDMVVELAIGVWADRTGKRIGHAFSNSGGITQPVRDARGMMNGLADVVCVPMISQGQTIGVLWAGCNAEISDEEVRILSAVADIAANALRRAALHEQTQRRLQHITALRAIDMAITSSLDLRVTLNFFLDQVTIRLGIHAASVLLLDPRTQILQFTAGRGFHTQALHHTKLRLGEGVAGRAALERRMIHIPDLTKSSEAFRRAPMLTEEGFVSYFAAPLMAKGQVKGVLEIFHRAPLEPDNEWLEFLDTLAVQAAIAIDNAGLFEGLQRSNLELAMAYDATIEGWSRALDLRDRETEGHTLRVTDMTLRLARSMGVTEEELVHMRRGALLHDIGKMGIPDNILLKPGPLTDEEWLVMRRHPEYAYELLSLVNYLRPALLIPYCHHEKWDGTGYPRGLREEAIPLAARLFAVVDVWDALRSERPYRQAWPADKVRGYLMEQSGKHFDPQALSMFIKLLDQEEAAGVPAERRN